MMRKLKNITEALALCTPAMRSARTPPMGVVRRHHSTQLLIVAGAPPWAQDT